MDLPQNNVALSTSPNEIPLVSLVDVDARVRDLLISKKYNVTTATVGSPIRVDNLKPEDSKWLKFNYSFPVNLHEYDVVVVDFSGGKTVVPFKNYVRGNAVGGKYSGFLSAYPEKVFNSRPGGIRALGRDVNLLLKKKSVVIFFADTFESAQYQPVTAVGSQQKLGVKNTADTQDFYVAFPDCHNRVGSRIKSASNKNFCYDLVERYSKGSQYKAVFEHPTRYEKRVGSSVKVSGFIPIALNERDEVVSYVHKVDSGYVYCFPQMEDKGGFLIEFFALLSEQFPEIFPCSGQFSWLDGGEYPVPGEIELLQKRQFLIDQFSSGIKKNEIDVLAVKNEYGFLRDLISQTGEILVEAVATYFRWLGFDSVVDYDDVAEEVFEEDLQVLHGEKLLVVEVKGIGGTSTDQACMQISKIRNRRMKQRESFEVYGLYVVNHQRYLPPSSRQNPPFTAHQLSDAVSDDRGLITTYQLYQAYFLIRDGVLKKDDIKDQLLGYGLLDLAPSNLSSLGVPLEYFSKGTVIVVDLGAGSLSIGDEIVVRKDASYKKLTVESLKIDGVEVSCASGVVVGIKINAKVSNNSEVFIYSAE